MLFCKSIPLAAVPALILLIILSSVYCLADQDSIKTITPTDGMKITSDTVLAPGVYTLEKGLEIAANGVTLDGGGAMLVGRDCKITGNVISGNPVEDIRLIDSRGNTVADNTKAEPAKEDPDIRVLPWDVRR